MNGNFVVLILGVLVVAYLAYFTHTVLRPRASTATVATHSFDLRDGVRKQVVEEVRAAAEQRSLPPADVTREVERASAACAQASTLRPSRCLWVDHDPDGIVHERRMAELLKVDVDVARTTNQALQFMVGRRYDFVVTDLTRPVAGGGVDNRAGIKLLKMLAGAPTVPPVVVYADIADGGAQPPDAEVVETVVETVATTGSSRPAAKARAEDDDVAADDDAAEDDAAPDDTDEPATGDAARVDGSGDDASDPRLDDARAAGARAAITSPAALLDSLLDIVTAG